MHCLRSQMPALFGLQLKQDQLATLETVFQAVSKEYKIPLGLFPNTDRYRTKLNDWIDRGQPMARLPCDKPRSRADLNTSLEPDIPSLMKNWGAKSARWPRP